MQGETSSAAQEEQTTDSVFDFLYHDGRRVASFLAQFDSSGSLTQISNTVHAEKLRVDSQKLEGSVGPRFAKAGMASVDETRSRRQDDIMRVYDPTWSNARAFLDYLDEAGLIRKDISEASIGQIVLCSGSLVLKNLQLLTSLWSLPSAKRMLSDGVKASSVPPLGRKAKSNPAIKAAHELAIAEAKNTRDGLDLFIELVPTLPHTVQATLTGDEQVWCSLLQEGLTFDPSDISLKFSDKLPGEWYALGILDALPDDQPSGEIQQVDYLSGAALSKLTDAINPMVRAFLGRPYEAYGITPLLIFREISAR